MRRYFTVIIAAIMGAALLAGVSAALELDISTAEKKITEDPRLQPIRWKFSGNSLKYDYNETADAHIKAESDIPGKENLDEEFGLTVTGSMEYVPDGMGAADLTIKKEQHAKAESGDSFNMQGSPLDAKNVTLTVKHGPDGKIEVEGGENDAVFYEAKTTLDQLYQMPPYPDPEPGDSWDTEMDYFLQDEMEGPATINTKFVEWVEKDGKTYARFDFVMKVDKHQSQEIMESSIVLNATGTWYFDTLVGKVARSTVEYEMTMTTEINYEGGEDFNDRSVHMEMTLSAEGTAEMVPAE